MDPGGGGGGGGDMDATAARVAAMDPFPDLSEEEIISMLEAYEKSGMGLGPVPENLEASGCQPATFR